MYWIGWIAISITWAILFVIHFDQTVHRVGAFTVWERTNTHRRYP